MTLKSTALPPLPPALARLTTPQGHYRSNGYAPARETPAGNAGEPFERPTVGRQRFPWRTSQRPPSPSPAGTPRRPGRHEPAEAPSPGGIGERVGWPQLGVRGLRLQAPGGVDFSQRLATATPSVHTPGPFPHPHQPTGDDLDARSRAISPQRRPGEARASVHPGHPAQGRSKPGPADRHQPERRQEVAPMPAKIDSDYCGVVGCGRPRFRNKRRGPRSRWCSAHRKRKCRTGDVQADVPIMEWAPYGNTKMGRSELARSGRGGSHPAAGRPLARLPRPGEG
jgi:hypothetical protein